MPKEIPSPAEWGRLGGSLRVAVESVMEEVEWMGLPPPGRQRTDLEHEIAAALYGILADWL